ncbi:MAG: phospholipid carrier-dependent glycosyltransferase [Leucobacter sp.]
MRWPRWLAPAVVLGIAAALRFWALSRPGTLVFDELYYVRDAISQLAHGYPTTWPDDEPGMAGARATAFTGAPANAVHPPLGKWLIGLGILVFGPGSGWGWRSAAALAGVATVAVVMALGWRMSRSLAIACTAGLLLAIDGVHVTLTRVGLLDGFLAFFIALGALFAWRDQEAVAPRSGTGLGIAWRRPWLLAAGLAFGAAASVKWSGLYPLAFFLVYATVRDLLARMRARRTATGAGRNAVAGSGSPDSPSPSAERGTSGVFETGSPRRSDSRQLRAWIAAALQALAAAAIALPAAVAVYLASWLGWILHPGGWARTPGAPWPVDLVRYHAQMLEWHSTLSAPHPYQSHPLTWPLGLIPTAMYESRWTEGCPWGACVSEISPIPNPLVTWGGLVALLVLTVLAARRAWTARAGAGSPRPSPDPLVTAASFALAGYLSGWLPWVLTFSRSAVFQFYAVVLTPFSALALALLLGLLCGIPIRSSTGVASGLRLDPSPEALRGRRIAVGIFVGAAVLLAAFFFPLWSGTPIAEWFWRVHLWLPRW